MWSSGCGSWRVHVCVSVHTCVSCLIRVGLSSLSDHREAVCASCALWPVGVTRRSLNCGAGNRTLSAGHIFTFRAESLALRGGGRKDRQRFLG